MTRAKSSTSEFEAASKKAAAEHYVLRLFIAGTTPASSRAVETLRAICEEHLLGRYELEVVDVFQQPVLARDEQIIAVPTLLKKVPAPLRRIVGDLSNEHHVLVGLDIKPKQHGKKTASKKR